MKKSFTLLEVIFVIIISSLFILSSTLFLKNMALKNDSVYKKREQHLDLKSSFVFIQNNVKEINTLNFQNNNLYFDKKLLLENLLSYEINKNTNAYTIKICLQLLCQKSIIYE